MTTLESKINRLMELGKRAVELSDCHKSTEPGITLVFRNDGSYYLEFYSYCLDLQDGGRHHVFDADSFDGLLAGLDRFIAAAENEIKLLEREQSEYGSN